MNMPSVNPKPAVAAVISILVAILAGVSAVRNGRKAVSLGNVRSSDE